jgi:phospholipid transport system substrate-binding protein
MKAGATLDLEGRRAKLAPVVDRAYDLQFMGAKTLGSHWRALDQSERGRWLEAFRRLTVSTYAERFSDWSGEKLEVLDAVPADRGTAVVHTRIVPAKEEPIEINYRMRPGDDGWRIIDVYLNGTVSELALRRSEYSAVIDRDGFNHLIESLDEKTLAPGPASPGKQ